MPKERVNSAGYRQYDIVVGWDKETHNAQLAVVHHPDDEPNIRIGSKDEVFDGLYVTLDGDNIEQLIKTLRKVKRQMFQSTKKLTPP